MNKILNQKPTLESKNLRYGMKELAKLLGCSTVCAQGIKNSGKIPYFQTGRLVFFDPEKVLKALERGAKE